jgi:hypothetical protein
MKPGRSTLAQAGRGAFAARQLPVDTVVGYAPLVHIGTKGRNIFDVVRDNPDGTQFHSYDLIINYSFGHANSTVLLTPYGGMVNYINHDKERANGKLLVFFFSVVFVALHLPFFFSRRHSRGLHRICRG